LANDGQAVPLGHIQAALPGGADRRAPPQTHQASLRRRLPGAPGPRAGQAQDLEAQALCQLELDFAKGIEQVNAARRKQRENDTADLFKNYQQWIKDTLELDDRAQITIVAVLAA
jgi:hypothetical protein